jgi:uncharacterized protein (UPF0297 family)
MLTITPDENICPYSDEELKDLEREHICGMCDIEAWEMYKEAEKRGFNPVTAISRFYSGTPQEWDECDELCPYSNEILKDMERERICGMCDIEAWEMYKEAEKRGFNPIYAITRFYLGEPQEWEK